MTSTSGPSTLDDLATAARDNPDGPRLILLWRALFALERWWLLPTGDAANPRPMIGTSGGRRFLLAFTSEQRLTEFARQQQGHAPGSDVAAMALTPAELSGLGPELRKQGIDCLLFDQGVHDFLAPIAMLESLSAQKSAGPSDRSAG